VLPYLEGKEVLDVGAASGHRRPDWMHRLVVGVASSVVGVELDPVEAARAAALGFDVRQGDAENLSLEERFDVVWAGELIEHLSCPGAFLDGVNVASLALMAVVTFQLGAAALVDAWALVLCFLSALLLVRFKTNSTWLVLGGAAAGGVLHGLGLA